MAALHLPAFLSVLLIQVYSLRVPRSGEKITVTTIEERPFLFVKDEGGSGNDNFQGYIPDLLKKIKAKTNIDYEIRRVGDGQYGSKSGNTWSGMVGELISREADLAAAPMTVSDKRKQAIDFTRPFMEFTTTILMKKPEGENPITTAGDLADQTEIKYGLVKGGSTENFFRNTQDQTYGKMWQEISKQTNNVDKVEDGVDKVRSSNGKYAFIIEEPTANYWISQEPCDLVKVGNGINKSKYAFGVRKGDPLKSKIDAVISEMQQNGDLDRLEKKWWDERSECDTSAAPHLVVSTFLVLCAVVATRSTL